MAKLLKTLLLVSIVLAGGCVVPGDESSKLGNDSTSASRVSNGSLALVGQLGLPLGTPVEVEGTLTPPRESPYSLFPVELRLVIDTVAGKKLGLPIELRFTAERPLDSKLENSELGLKRIFDELVGTYQVTSEQAKQMYAEYATIRRKLLVYESGRFIGRPERLPPTWPRTAIPPFGFETFLVVVKAVEPEPQVENPEVRR